MRNSNSRPYGEYEVPGKRENPDSMDYSSSGDKGFKSDRDRSRRDEDVNLRSLKVLGSDRKSGTDKGPDRAFSCKSPLPRTSFGIDRDGSDRGDGTRSFWRKSYGSDREGADGCRESVEMSEGSRTPSRKYDRDNLETIDSVKVHSMKSFGSDLERGDGPRTPSRRSYGYERDVPDRSEAHRPSVRNGVGGEKDGYNTAEVSKLSPTKTYANGRDIMEKIGTKSAARKGSGSEDRGESMKDLIIRGLSLSDRDGLDRGDAGRSPSDKGAGLERDAKDSPRISPRRVGYHRDGAGEATKGSPRRSSGLDRDGTETLKISPRKGFGAGRDAIERTESYRSSPRERERTYREGEKPSPGKGLERERWYKGEKLSPGKGPERERIYREGEKLSPGRGTERERIYREGGKLSPGKGYVSSLDGPWSRHSSKPPSWGHDRLEYWDCQKNSGRFVEKEDRRKRTPDNLTPLCGKREDRDEEARTHIVKRLRSERDKPRREETPKSQTEKDAAHELDIPSELDGRRQEDGLLLKGPDCEAGYREEICATLQSMNGMCGKGTDDTHNIKARLRDSSEKELEEENSHDKSDCIRIFETSCSSKESEMEEGELVADNDSIGRITKMREPEHTDEGTANIDNKVDDGEQCTAFATKMEVHCAGLQQIDGGIPLCNVEADEPENPLDGQYSVAGLGVVMECGRTSEHKDQLQKEHVEAQELRDRIAKELTCKPFDVETRTDIEMEKGYEGLTLDLLNREPVGKVKEVSSNLHQEVASQDSLTYADDPGRELALSLMISRSATEVRMCKGSNFSKAGSGKEVNVMELQKKEEVQSANGMCPSDKGCAIVSVETAEQSFGKQKLKRVKLEPLQLSLALPDISVRQASSHPAQIPGSPGPERNIQSLNQTCTNSDGFTTSLSLSHSHFVHNPSCSLTRTSFENQEFSCASQQTTQGNEQTLHSSRQAPCGNDQASHGSYGFTGFSQSRWKPQQDVPVYTRPAQNGNLQSHQGLPTVSGSNKGSSSKERGHERVGSNQVSQASHQIARILSTAKNVSLGNRSFDKQGVLHKDVQDRLCKEVWHSHAQSVGSQEILSEQHRQLERGRLISEREWCTLPQRDHSAKDDDAAGAKSLGNEKIGLLEIVKEPVAIMARKLQELPDSFLEGLKDLVKEMLGSIEKREEFMNLQKIIQRRADLTQETLLRAHRTQLELLVALKTGMQAFVHPDCRSLTYKALIEIFLQTRCRNFGCQAPLPVDGCECRICSQKSGFCNACMCVVCSKFDFDANTCRWVGCDFCMHWCHTDCGIRMSYIAPGPSIRGAAGTSGMQFRCIACGHPSELFGFVKEVFSTFAREWNSETLAKELDCVRRIFHSSEDMRGKKLCWKAEEMLQKLDNKVDTMEVCTSILRFFTEGNTITDGACGSALKTLNSQEKCDRLAGAVREAILKINSNSGSKVTELDRARATVQTFDRDLEEKRTEAIELQCGRTQKKAEIEELERGARIKQKESTMFQLRADEARQEAEGLRRIVLAKSDKIEENFACRLAKLQLTEAEERRRKRLEELEVLEREQNDFQSMKIRMEVDIKDLLKRMEATKRQVS